MYKELKPPQSYSITIQYTNFSDANVPLAPPLLAVNNARGAASIIRWNQSNDASFPENTKKQGAPERIRPCPLASI
jgi:hypothetical protein